MCSLSSFPFLLVGRQDGSQLAWVIGRQAVLLSQFKVTTAPKVAHGRLDGLVLAVGGLKLE